jgi:hypothetical protein
VKYFAARDCALAPSGSDLPSLSRGSSPANSNDIAQILNLAYWMKLLEQLGTVEDGTSQLAIAL